MTRSSYGCARQSRVWPSSFSKSGSAKVEYRSSSMSSPSRTKDLQAAHWPSLQPCMSWTPCSAAARRMVWSSSTSISMPTGSKRTRCLSPMAHVFSRIGWSWAGGCGGGPGGTRPSPSPDPRSGARGGGRPAGRALAVVVGDERSPLLVAHLVEQDVRGQDGAEPLEVLGRPHLLRVEVQVRLRRHRLPVVADAAHVLDDLVPGPAVVQRLPLAVADQPAHVRGLAALVHRAEGLDVGPAAGLAAVGAVHPVDLGGDHVLTDEAGHHAGPAAVRVHVVDVLADDRLVPVRHGQAGVVLPPLAVLVVPARVLVLEPLEVLVGHRVDW